MPDKIYTGSCQCGAIAFRLTADGPTTEYRFNKHVISHRFCPTCGIQPYATGEQDGQTIVAVNVNCLDGVDARALDSQVVDGASA